MKTKLENNMEDIFNLPEAAPISDIKISEAVVIPTDETVDDDIAYARDNLYKIVESGNDALETLLNVAKASESPRAFEVVQQFIKTMADANKDLVELQRKKKLLKADVEKAEAEKKKVTKPKAGITRPKEEPSRIDLSKTQEYDLSLSPAAEKERNNLFLKLINIFIFEYIWNKTVYIFL